MKKYSVLAVAVLAVTNVTVLGNTLNDNGLMGESGGVGVQVSFSDAQSADCFRHADRSGIMNLTFTAEDTRSYIGAKFESGKEYTAGDFSYSTGGDTHVDGNGSMSRAVGKESYGISGGIDWLLGNSSFLAVGADFSSDLRHDINDRSQNMVRRVSSNSDVLIGNVSTDALHEIDETPVDFNAGLAYSGGFGKWNILFKANFFTNQNGRNSTIGETGLDNSSYNVISRNMDKNRMVASRLDMSYNGMLDFGSEVSSSYHYSDYFLGGKVPATQASQNDVVENTVSAFANFHHDIGCTVLAAGLNYEHVSFSYADVLDRSADFDRTENNLYPSVSVRGCIMSSMDFGLDYSCRALRPDFSLLDNSIHYGSRFMFRSGNTELTRQLEQKLTMDLKCGIFSIKGKYIRLDNPIIQMFSSIGKTSPYYSEGAVIEKPVNAGSPMRSLAVDLECPVQLGDIAVVYLGGGIYDQWFELDAGNDVRLSFSGQPVWSAAAAAYVPLWTGGSLNSDFEFRSRGYQCNAYIQNSLYGLNASFRQEFGRLTLTVEGRDLLKHTYSDTRIDCGGVTVRKCYMADTRRIQATLSYSFGVTASACHTGNAAGFDILGRMK